MLRSIAFSIVRNSRRGFCNTHAISGQRLLSILSFQSNTLPNFTHSNKSCSVLFPMKQTQGFYRPFSTLPNHTVVGLPALSPTMDTGMIANWNVKEGDKFSPGMILCQVQTDKATVDFEAQDEGVVAKILVDAGSREIKIGEPIMVTVSDVSDVDAFKTFSLQSESSKPPAKPAESPKLQQAAPPSQPPKENKPVAQPISTTTPVPSHSERVFASPYAKKLAREKGYSLNEIRGTGPNGRIIAADVLEYVPSVQQQPQEVSQPAPSSIAAQVPSQLQSYTDYPISDNAKTIAARLAQTKKAVPHYYLTVDLNLDAILKVRDQLNASLPEESHLTLNDLLVKAAANSMKEVPAVNSSWMESFVRQYNDVHINLVMGIGEGLVAPLVRNVDTKGLKALSTEVKSLFSGALNNTLTEEAYQSGTFTVVNLGSFGVKSVTPIVHSPQACILGLGAAEDRVIPNEDENAKEIYRIATMLTATLSCDHRVVDGAVGAQWLAVFKNYVENPLKLLF